MTILAILAKRAPFPARALFADLNRSRAPLRRPAASGRDNLPAFAASVSRAAGYEGRRRLCLSRARAISTATATTVFVVLPMAQLMTALDLSMGRSWWDPLGFPMPMLIATVGLLLVALEWLLAATWYQWLTIHLRRTLRRAGAPPRKEVSQTLYDFASDARPERRFVAQWITAALQRRVHEVAPAQRADGGSGELSATPDLAAELPRGAGSG